ncbi:MAG: hydrogenase iron-sulfur subunit [Candidatus Cloacimonetes bacterium]|nr:hydrogenase iron-sulfur subunit [Candidatus Cloacimonadota bacterium]
MLTKIFDTLGLESKRLKLSWISASEGTKFAKVSNEYTEEIKSYGENPSKLNVFL